MTIERKKKIENRYGKKNDCIEILNDKLTKLYSRKLGHGYERKTSKEKLNIF